MDNLLVQRCERTSTMDGLTHVFRTIAYVLRRALFQQPRYLTLGLFGLLSDFDKPLGVLGLLYSLLRWS